MTRRLVLTVSFGLMTLLAACSSAKKKLELSELEGKKVALVSLEAEPSARKIVEVALVNQLVKRGTFLLASQQEVEAARQDPQQDPLDWKGIARRAGADYALQVRVLEFDAKTHEGHASAEVYDSTLAEEQGTDGKTQQVYRVKVLRGKVRFELAFTELPQGPTLTGYAEAQDQVEGNAKTSSIHLPPVLRFLETLSNKAFREFFDRYN